MKKQPLKPKLINDNFSNLIMTNQQFRMPDHQFQTSHTQKVPTADKRAVISATRKTKKPPKS